MQDTLIELFCDVDDFCQLVLPEWNQHLLIQGLKQRNRPGQLSPSEIMTIYIHFHQSHYRNFKSYYLYHVCQHLNHFFPKLVTYPRFVTLIKSVMVPLCFFLRLMTPEKTGIYFIDSTLIKVCHIKRAKQNRVFKGLAQIGKSSIGWFFGFKLHLVINHEGELMGFKLTAANVDDRDPVMELTKNLIGKLVGDKGYISQVLFDKLFQKGLQLITRIKKNMKNKLMPLIDKLLLRKRGLIETVNDQLKNITQVEHSRHRSIWNFFANILGALIAYSLQPKKPSLNLGLKFAEANA